jgi:hypothetical protein
MKEPENKSPAEVLRAKRLEIVDDEDKVRAALGTEAKSKPRRSIERSTLARSALRALYANKRW